MRTLHAVCASLSIILALGACASEPEQNSGSQQANHTELGLLGWAPQITYGQTVAGTISGDEFDVWGITLQQGDTLSIVKTVTEGTLAPDFGLFYGGVNKVSSDSYDAQPTQLVKHYTVRTGGQHFIGVRAYQGQGSGDYTLVATCTGGPCAGEPVPTQLDVEQRADCLEAVRVCAFERMKPYDGAVGPARARSIVEECQQSSTIDNGLVTCAGLCELDDTKNYCEHLIDQLPFYADASEACLKELDYCIDACKQYTDHVYDVEQLYETVEAMCLYEGFNGDCFSYAPKHEFCGGSLQDGSEEQCYEFCESTSGATIDDLDTICSDECGNG